MNKNGRTNLPWLVAFLLLLSMTSCTASPLPTKQTQTPREVNLSEQANPSNRETQDRPDASEGVPPATEPASPAIRTATATAVLPVSDADLTHLLTTHQLAPGYGEARLHLLENGQLLVWFDSAALFDLRSEALLGTYASLGKPGL
jgi:hypothetical protein